VGAEISWVAQRGCGLRPSPIAHRRARCSPGNPRRKSFLAHLALPSTAGSSDAVQNTRCHQRGDRSPAIRLRGRVLIDGRPTLAGSLLNLLFALARWPGVLLPLARAVGEGCGCCCCCCCCCWPDCARIPRRFARLAVGGWLAAARSLAWRPANAIVADSMLSKRIIAANCHLCRRWH
jgi:hypothetical protein